MFALNTQLRRNGHSLHRGARDRHIRAPRSIRAWLIR